MAEVELGEALAALTAEGEPLPPDVYAQLGIEPFINCCGEHFHHGPQPLRSPPAPGSPDPARRAAAPAATTTINGGSRTSAAVIDAMHAAMHYSVDMEALIPAAGARIAGLL